MSFTPGPWHFESHKPECDGVDVVCEIKFNDSFKQARLQSQEHLEDPDAMLAAECIANARLIAAAPELLAALEAMHEAFKYTSHNAEEDEANRMAAAAIKKARGQA